MAATYGKATPFADWKAPAPTSLIWKGSTYRAAVLDAVETVLATNAGPAGMFTSGLYERFLMLSQTYTSGDGDVRGRWLDLWNAQANSFHASGRRLLGDAQVDYPDVLVMDDAVFCTDSQGRWNAGTAPFGFVFSDDGGVFTDESTDAQDNGTGDVQITPSAAWATNDAFYVGAAVPFSGLMVLIDRALVIGTGGTSTFVAEYFGGGTWTTATLTWDPGLSAFGTLGPLIGWFTSGIPGDWGTTTVNGQSAYWLRLRCTGASGAGYVSCTATKVFCVESVASTRGRLPAAYRLSNDPATNAEVSAWGIHSLETGGTAQFGAAAAGSGGSLTAGVVNVYYAWRNSTLDIQSKPVLLGSLTLTLNDKITTTIGAHPDHRVDQLRIYLEGISGAIAAAPTGATSTTLGTGKLRLVKTVAVLTNDGTEDITVVGLSAASRPMPYDEVDWSRTGDGPYVASHTASAWNLPANTHGTFLSTTEYLGRAWCYGSYVSTAETRWIASAPGNPWCFPPLSGNYGSVKSGQGDHAVAVRGLETALLFVNGQSMHLGTGDPGQGSFTVQEIAKIGGVAKRACVVAGQRCFVLGYEGIYVVEASGSVQKISGRITELLRGCTAAQLMNACGRFDPTRNLVLFALPGLQAQSSGGATHGQALNDGLLVLGLDDGTYTLWLGTGCYAASIGLWWTEDAQPTILTGGYWGRAHHFDYASTQDTQAGAISNGVVGSGSTSTTLRPSTGSCLNAATDWRQLGEWLLKWNATNGFEGRMIVNSNGTDFTVSEAWTNTPASGDLWWIGAYYMAVESGDLLMDSPRTQFRIAKTQLHCEDQKVAANAVDVAINATDVAEGAAYTFSGTTLGTTDAHQVFAHAGAGGVTQRFRIAALLNGARLVIRAISSYWESKGDAHGG